MKAVVLTGLGKVEVREVPAPRLERDDDILIRMGAIGICGSDIHYYLDGRIGDHQVVVHPAVIGHEGAGVVESAGPAAGGPASGRPGGGRAGHSLRPVRPVPGRPPEHLPGARLPRFGGPASRLHVRIHRHARAELPAAPREPERRRRRARRAAVDRFPQPEDRGRSRAAKNQPASWARGRSAWRSCWSPGSWRRGIST